MLVLSRKAGEVIRIGDDIEVVVLEIVSNKVRIGISAPREVPVHRQEVWDSINKGKGRSNAIGHEAVPATGEGAGDIPGPGDA